MHLKTSSAFVALTTALLMAGTAGTAEAGSSDSDRDGIPNRWERTHGMNPFRAADASRDFDGDRLSNLREYRAGSLIRDEDTDNDGHDDGDEATDGYRSTNLRDADTDNDGVRDGDEDADRDGIDNEDEDDAREACARDDDDRDRDGVDDEDENDYGLSVTSADSDRDGIGDGDEDADGDGEANEDDDDADGDYCAGDSDGDGEADEDEGDVLGTIASFDAGTGALVVTSEAGQTVTGTVTDETEIDFEDADGDESEEVEGDFEDREATTADLAPGVRVAEIELGDDAPGSIEEIQIYQVQQP